MKFAAVKMSRALVFGVAGILTAGTVVAQSPDWAGPDLSRKSEENRAKHDEKSGGTPAEQRAFRHDEEQRLQRERAAAAAAKLQPRETR